MMRKNQLQSSMVGHKCFHVLSYSIHYIITLLLYIPFRDKQQTPYHLFIKNHHDAIPMLPLLILQKYKCICIPCK